MSFAGNSYVLRQIGRSGSLSFFTKHTQTILAWALFDLANTFFAVAMLSFYFPLWVIEDQGAKELWYSLALGLSMACVALLMPLCGAISDATGYRMRFLRWTTYGCVGATALVAVIPHLAIALVLFGVANLCYQLGTIFYDALLWQVASSNRLGQTSGLGASFGYLGSALGLLMLWPFVRAGGHGAAFLPSAIFFLLFALPSFLMIRDPASAHSIQWRSVVRAAGLRLAITVRASRAIPGFWRYLWAAFFSLNAINTVLVFMAIYTKKVLGFSEQQVIQFFIFSQLFAIGGSLVFGRLIAPLGAKRTLTMIWMGWIAALTLVATTPMTRWIWLVGPMIGFCLGSTWATSRVLVTELSPKDQLAEMFGLAGLFGRSASILGPLIWGILVWEPSRYQHAVWAMIGLLAIGVWLLQGVRYPHAVQK